MPTYIVTIYEGTAVEYKVEAEDEEEAERFAEYEASEEAVVRRFGVERDVVDCRLA